MEDLPNRSEIHVRVTWEVPHNGSNVNGTQSEWCIEQGKGQELDREEGSQAVKPALGSKTAQQEKALGTSLTT